jgi:hypothetical protein
MEGAFRGDLIIPPWTMHEYGTPMDTTAYSVPTPYSVVQELVCSSSLDLERWPSIVWDVNGYYWSLGVSFRATRRQLASAYRARGGEDDPYLTYVFSQLLNPDVRRRYDACSLGGLFWDRYIDAKIRARAHRLAVKHEIDADQILRQWGYVDIDVSADQNGHTPELDIPKISGEDDFASPVWRYTFYMWRLKTSFLSEGAVDLVRLWQEAILAECHQHHVRARFAVGIMGSQRYGSDICMLSVQGATVLFVSTQVGIDSLERLAVIARKLLAS